MRSCILLLFISLFLNACYRTQVKAPSVQNIPQPKQALAQKKEVLQKKKKSASKLPEVLGGIVKSDEWIIYKEQEQEEFKGHVFYDNGQYVFKANYALSDRKQHSATARGNVYLKQKELHEPTTYEAWADHAYYNYKTGKGFLKSTSKTPARLQLTDTAQTVTATAKHISFDTLSQIFILTGNVHAKRITPDGTQTLQADKVTVKQLENYVRLDGNAVLDDDQRTVQADTVIYDGEHNHSTAYGARPLATGSTEQGTFAIIADTVTSDAQGTVVTLDGRVQGWVVSPELNNNKINQKF